MAMRWSVLLVSLATASRYCLSPRPEVALKHETHYALSATHFLSFRLQLREGRGKGDDSNQPQRNQDEERYARIGEIDLPIRLRHPTCMTYTSTHAA